MVIVLIIKWASPEQRSRAAIKTVGQYGQVIPLSRGRKQIQKQNPHLWRIQDLYTVLPRLQTLLRVEFISCGDLAAMSWEVQRV